METNNGYIVRLIHGEDLIPTIQKFCEENAVTSSSFQAIGAIENATLGFYHLDKKEYSWKEISTAHEIVSLTGNVAMVDGRPFIHAHTVLSNSEFQTIGGHLKNATVGATCEIFLTVFSTTIERIYDEETGLKLLNCTSDN